MRERYGGWVYILVGRTGTLYIGVTSDLYRRVLDHKAKIRSGFAAKYDCNRLVYSEEYDDIGNAIAREKYLKGWTRTKKMALIEAVNPEWKDLAAGWGKPLATLHPGNGAPPRTSVNPKFCHPERSEGPSQQPAETGAL